jgi:hypothetical protein
MVFSCWYLGSTPECFTPEEAMQFVKENFAIVNFDYADFSLNQYEKEEAVSLSTVVGTVGTCMHFFVRE